METNQNPFKISQVIISSHDVFKLILAEKHQTIAMILDKLRMPPVLLLAGSLFPY